MELYAQKHQKYQLHSLSFTEKVTKLKWFSNNHILLIGMDFHQYPVKLTMWK